MGKLFGEISQGALAHDTVLLKTRPHAAHQGPGASCRRELDSWTADFQEFISTSQLNSHTGERESRGGRCGEPVFSSEASEVRGSRGGRGSQSRCFPRAQSLRVRTENRSTRVAELSGASPRQISTRDGILELRL